MTPEQQAVVEVIRQHFGEPTKIRLPEVWGPRVVIEATTANGVIFVKAAGDADVRAEVTAIGLARAAGVPAPQVLAMDADPQLPGGYWFAMSAVAGTEWVVENESVMPETLSDIAHHLASLHRVRRAGFGPLDRTGNGTWEFWPDWIMQTARGYLDALVASGDTTDEFRSAALDIFHNLTPTIERGSLVHGDLTGCETFVDAKTGTVTGIVDWGGAVVADPIYEFAKLQAGGPADNPTPRLVLPAILDSYVAATEVDRVGIERILPLYRAHNALFNADWCRREGVPWIEGLLAAADAWLRAAWEFNGRSGVAQH